MRNILALIIILRAVATCTAATMATEGYVNARVAAASAASTQHVDTVSSALSNRIDEVSGAITLSNVLSVSQNAGGQSITNLASLRLRGNIESLVYARNTSSNIISPTSFGNIQLGFLGALGGGSGYIDLRAHTYGCIIAGYITGTSIVDWPNSGVMQLGINEGYRFVGSGSHGSMQIGYLGSYEDDDENLIPAYQTIGNSSPGAWQVGDNLGTMAIGNSSPAAMQIMSTDFGSSASNNAPAALQIATLGPGQHALTTEGGAGSLLIGAGTISNRNTIVVGDDQASHGEGSITAQSIYVATANTLALSLANAFSTNANSRLIISSSNGILRVQEVIQ